MTPLHDILIRQIARMGPISVAEYMTQCLYHPEHGYYTTTRPVGADGDFITAPEISQMFGEMIGLCLAQTWMDQGSPDKFALVELGPGRGTLMADILRATKGVADFHTALNLHLVENSPSLRAQQAETLSGFDPIWIDNINDLPQMPLFLVANEFFDCLPIRQFKHTTDGWQEHMITADGDQLAFMLGTATPLDVYPNTDIPQGGTLELCPSAAAMTGDIAARIAAHGGAALIFDYGDWGTGGDTLQALKSHSKTDVLDHAGASDLTAHVDFQALSNAAQATHVSGLTDQGVFLERLGITERAQTLAKPLTGQPLEDHISAHRRLTHPDEMGQLFKTLSIVPKGAPLPPGYSNA